MLRGISITINVLLQFGYAKFYISLFGVRANLSGNHKTVGVTRGAQPPAVEMLPR